MLMLLLPGAPAWAGQPLTAPEVFVVANSASEDSVSAADAYVRARGIPKDNLLAIPTSTAEEITRDEYDKQIRRPLLRALQERRLTDRVRCLCLIYGVPVRIAPDADEGRLLLEAYRAFLKEAAGRLAASAQRVAAVDSGGPVPAPPPAPAATGRAAAATPPEWTRAEMDRLLARAAAALLTMPEGPKRQAASRQLAQAWTDVHGLRGLIEFVERYKPAGAANVDDLRRQLRQAEEELAAAGRLAPSPDSARRRLALTEKTDGIALAWTFARGQVRQLSLPQANASVDSELAILLWDRYELGGPLPNPLNWRNALAAGTPAPLGPATASGAAATSPSAAVLMTSRLDGPSRGDVLRIIKASLAAEKTGLRGTFYIDAGGAQRDYDVHLKQLYRNLKAESNFPVVIEETARVFAPASCPRAALYVGWHSRHRYVPSMMWAPGAVGWHIAGSEARELRSAASTDWVPQMIRNGVAATVGAVEEPTLGAFPVPEDFFGLLLTGKYTVAQCYWRTVGHVSWRVLLIADPLYNPFANNPQLSVKELPKGMEP